MSLLPGSRLLDVENMPVALKAASDIAFDTTDQIEHNQLPRRPRQRLARTGSQPRRQSLQQATLPRSTTNLRTALARRALETAPATRERTHRSARSGAPTPRLTGPSSKCRRRVDALLPRSISMQRGHTERSRNLHRPRPRPSPYM
jgi:hypothetical protein